MHFGDNCPYYFVSFIWLSICSRQAFLLCHHRLLKFELIASAIYILKAHLHYGKKLKFQFILGNGWFHSAEKTARTPDVTGWGVSEGKASCLGVKHPALDIHLAKGSRVYQLHSDSSPGSSPAPLQEAWKAAPQPEVQVAAGSREHHPEGHRRCLTCSRQVRGRWAQLLLGRHELARREKPISAGLWH